MTTTTRPRGRRPATPVPALALVSRLTGRDRRLLRLLAEHRVLTTDQLVALLFPNRSIAQHRLVKLWRWHAVDRFRHPGRDALRTTWRYTLGPAGAAVLAAETGATPPRPAVVRDRTLRLAATHPNQLAHLLGANDLFAALAAHARRHPEHRLDTWLGETAATVACGRLARPDGLGVWTHHTRRVVFCLEYDTGSEPLTRVAAKLAGYADLADAGGPRLGGHSEHGHIGAFTVLIHLHSPARETALHRQLQTNPHAPQPTDGWQVATSHTDNPDSPTGPAWLPVGVEARRRLAHLDTA